MMRRSKGSLGGSKVVRDDTLCRFALSLFRVLGSWNKGLGSWVLGLGSWVLKS